MVDVLSRHIEKAVTEEKLVGICIKRECYVLQHLFFADEFLFFVKGTQPNMQSLQAIIDEYWCASGQGVNLVKSSLFLSPNIQEEEKRSLEHAMGIQSVNNLVKYLGLPSMWGRSKRETLSFLKKRIQDKLQSWKAKNSQQCRERGPYKRNSAWYFDICHEYPQVTYNMAL